MGNFNKGFTLLELLLVIAIVASLAGLIINALNPAERLAEATEAKAASNAKDLEKALNTYVLDNGGIYPTALQSLFTAGYTRVDICRSGQTCNGVDLTSELVAGGYLSQIPLHANYATSTDSGYDLIYDSTKRSIRIVEAPVFLLREDFLIDAAAPLTSPRTAEPGPGTLTIYDTDSVFSIVNGRLRFTRATSGTASSTITLGSYSRVAGRGGVVEYRPISGIHHNVIFNLVGSVNTNEEVRTFGTAVRIAYSYGSGISIVDGTEYQFALIARSSGAFYLGKGGTMTDWTLVYPYYGSTTALTPFLSSYTQTHTDEIDKLRILDFGEPWNSDYGIATYREPNTVALNTTFAHRSSFVLDYTVTNRGSSGNTSINFRNQDNNNHWRILVNANGDLNLYENVANNPISRGSSAGVITNGTRVIALINGSRINIYTNNVLRITYNSANTFNTLTSGKLYELGTDAEITNLVTYPLTIDGEAAEALNNALL